MDIINRQELVLQKEDYFDKINSGSVFIHPTDTIYGLGCDATNFSAVMLLRELKQRTTMPFSVIAPSIKWIRENCETEAIYDEWISKLPGPYTLVLKLKNKRAIAGNVNCGLPTLGVRIPKHWFSKVVEELDKPVVTTSANISGENFMTHLEELDSRISSKLEFAIYEGPKKGKPSTLVKLIDGKAEIIER